MSHSINQEQIVSNKIQIDSFVNENEISTKITKKNKKLKKQLKIKQKQLKRQQTLKQRPNLNEKIDKSLDSIHKNNLEILARNQANKHAETILTEINNKKSDALKYINLLKSLNELRTLRRIKERLPDPNEQVWREKIHQLIAVWEDTLEEYLHEESKLKSLLAYNSKSLEDQWCEVIFGDKEREKKSTKKSNLIKFFDIRRIWDSYKIPDNMPGIGSKIPPGWVLPPKNPSKEWAAFLFN